MQNAFSAYLIVLHVSNHSTFPLDCALFAWWLCRGASFKPQPLRRSLNRAGWMWLPFNMHSVLLCCFLIILSWVHFVLWDFLIYVASLEWGQSYVCLGDLEVIMNDVYDIHRYWQQNTTNKCHVQIYIWMCYTWRHSSDTCWCDDRWGRGVVYKVFGFFLPAVW